MKTDSLKSVLESLLFVAGDPVSIEDLAKVTGESEEIIEHTVWSMREDYQKEDRGIRIICINDAYQLCSKSENYDYIAKYTQRPKSYRLTQGQLEVLAIIAYKQPVTRALVEKIRGVHCDKAINKLIELGLVEEAGRLKTPGRPMLFGTTDEFLRKFGVSSPKELPIIDPLRIEEFKREADVEISERELEG